MDIIKYNTTLKASGNDYKKIVFWNRFIRNPIETILTWLPAFASIFFIANNYLSTYLCVIYAALWAYPIYIFFIQFNNSVKYHLKNREASENAPCTMNLNQICIIADIPDYSLTYTYNWNSFTSIYYRMGYYMFFEKSKMVLMLKKSDMTNEQQLIADNFIKSHIDMNLCKVFF